MPKLVIRTDSRPDYRPGGTAAARRSRCPRRRLLSARLLIPFRPLARTRRLGEWLGGGAPLAEALERLGDTAEGVPTTTAALQLAERMGVEMPIASVLKSVLSGDASPTDAVAQLLGRDPRAELAGTPPSSR